jgi:uncharacterized membrane protein YfcA
VRFLTAFWHRKAAPTGWQGNLPASRFAQVRDDLERRIVDKAVCRLSHLDSNFGRGFLLVRTMEVNFLFLVAIFAVAFMYASVGHGGASGYLALMALFGVSTEFMRASALSLNLFVSAISFYAFYRGGHFKIKIMVPFVIGSIPLAFLGAKTTIEPHIFKIILGIFLLIAVARMVYVPQKSIKEIIPFNFALAVAIGAFLGFFSGLIGIGGGIILSPVLLLMGWTNIKETAAISASFIFLNSASGLLGLQSSGMQISPQIVYWIVVALAGGLLGAYVGSYKLSLVKLRYLLAFVLLLASVKLIFT